MRVRLRFLRGAAMGRIAGQRAPFASGLGALITLLSVACLLLALWRLTSDLEWTESFAISDGILSHWQVWMALAIAFGALAWRLKRLGHNELADFSESATQSESPLGAANSTRAFSNKSD